MRELDETRLMAMGACKAAIWISRALWLIGGAVGSIVLSRLAKISAGGGAR